MCRSNKSFPLLLALAHGAFIEEIETLTKTYCFVLQRKLLNWRSFTEVSGKEVVPQGQRI